MQKELKKEATQIESRSNEKKKKNKWTTANELPIVCTHCIALGPSKD